MTVLDDQLPGMLREGLKRVIAAQTGQRLDKRSLAAGYYAAAAIFAASQGKDSALVGLLTSRAQDAIDRKGVEL